jgi:hypothetical protein
MALGKLDLPLGKTIGRVVESANALKRFVGSPPEDFDMSALHLGKAVRATIADIEGLMSQLKRLASLLPEPR